VKEPFAGICLAALSLSVSAVAAESPIDEIVVTSGRQPTGLHAHVGNVASLNNDDIEEAAHIHIHELLTRVPGVWITRGSGQESQPAIRSPVLTGAGSCGAFLTLEDGIPSRPSGFCNVNQLFELPTELCVVWLQFGPRYDQRAAAASRVDGLEQCQPGTRLQ
jgi:outer membrane cobalamin receptor